MDIPLKNKNPHSQNTSEEKIPNPKKSILGRGRYFDGDVSRGFVSLYTGKTIVMVASGLLGIFMPIFLYNLFGQNFRSMILYYGTGYLLYGLLVAFGARFLNKFGFRRALRFSVLFGALFYTIFYFINEGNYLYLVPLSLAVVTAYRLLYWVPFGVDFAKFTDKENRGKQLSAVRATRNIIGVFIPIVAGLIISRFGFNILFLAAITLYLVSYVPYMTLPRTEEKFSWTYAETWRRFFSGRYRKTILAFMADGAETAVGVIVWPVFIYEILKGNYFQVGAVSTLIIAVTVIVQLYTGRYIDTKKHRHRILRWGTLFYSMGWIVKIFIATSFQIFITGTYHSLAKIFTRTPFDVLTYEMAADNGHYIDEFTVLHEMAVCAGRTLMVASILFISLFFAIQWTFILAAGAALLLNLLTKKGAMIEPRAEA